jgi:PIN domain nuclease of toxin-antitoxin system
MKPLLLDTHVVSWWLIAPKRLSRASYARIESADASVSVIGLWEMLIKRDSGKLKLPATRDPDRSAGLSAAALRAEHVSAAGNLGGMHGDPYDRLLVGTAMAEQTVLMTRDSEILERARPLLGDLLMEA